MCVPKTSAPAAVADTQKPVYLHNAYLDGVPSDAQDANGGANVTNRSTLEIPKGIGFAGRGTSTNASAGAGTIPTQKRAQADSTLPLRPYQPTPDGAYTGPTDSAGNPQVAPTVIGPPDPGAPQGGSTGVSPGTFPTPDPGYFIDPNDPFGVPFRIPTKP
jgi:hypothetical protein